MNAERDFLKKLIATFRAEADEHIKSLASGLVELETAKTDEDRAEAVEKVFRTAHSLKGAARSVDLGAIEGLCQSLENVFSALKKQQIAPSATLFDLLQQAADELGLLLASLDAEGQIAGAHSTGEIARKLAETSKGMTGETKQPGRAQGAAPVTPKPMGAQSNTIRISTSKLADLILETEELLLSKLAVGDRTTELKTLRGSLDIWLKEHKNDRQTSDMISKLRNEVATIESRVRGDARILSGLVDTLIDDMKQVMMLPFSSALELLPKLARDLARDENKQLDLTIKGGEIEVDRRILEALKDPLVHLLRNAIDHGIESPADRLALNKDPRGKIRIDIEQVEGNKVDIAISDDGRGIEIEEVRSSAEKAGLPDRSRNEADILRLLFRSGVSTSPLITDISGRGLGLAIVEEKTGQLGGSVGIESEAGRGTTVKMTVPVALATFRGVLIRVGGMLMMLPIVNVERVLRISQDQITTVENREEIILDGKAVSLMKLSQVLGIPETSAVSRLTPCVIAGQGDKRIAFLVDEVVEEQEVLVKALGKQLPRVRNISGAAVLGSGNIVPVINVSDLMRSAIGLAAGQMNDSDMALPRKSQTVAPAKRILVVEDSITARILLRNILQTAGYQVTTAVDGLDALSFLKTGDFDLVASDINMPRMDGLELTSRIRAGQKTSDLPVVLVSARESREDREKSIEAGANAYIVKSSFDQSNLLEVIERLI